MSARPDQVVCPRCGQDWVAVYRFTKVDKLIQWCPECDASWSVGVTPVAPGFRDIEEVALKLGLASPAALEPVEPD